MAESRKKEASDVNSGQDAKNILSEKISYLIGNRERHNESQFARRVGVSATAVRKWLFGESPPKKIHQEKICNAYGVSMEWLNGKSKYMNFGLVADIAAREGEFEREQAERQKTGYNPDDEEPGIEGATQGKPATNYDHIRDLIITVRNQSAAIAAASKADESRARADEERARAERARADAELERERTAGSTATTMKKLVERAEQLSLKFDDIGVGETKNGGKKIFQVQNNNKAAQK